MKILIRKYASSKWQVVHSSDYRGETDLQKLLAESPDLITIEDIRAGAPPLVAAVREVGLPGSGNTDILAFNARGDIVVVECKLAGNTEIKRKVIAQVLEYGAYLWKMSYEDLDARISSRAGQSLADLVRDASNEPDWDEEGFRSTVGETLKNGAFILVIAVDEMNEELGRTIRFLNTCGNPEFAFTALEMRRYKKDDIEILVPHLFGGEAKLNQIDTGVQRKQWTEERFFQTVDDTLSPEVAALIKDLYAWTKVHAHRVWFGIGASRGSFTFHYLLDGKTVSVFSIYTDGALTLNYGWLSKMLKPEDMQTFHAELVAIPTFKNIPADFSKWPSIRIENAFGSSAEHLAKFKAAVEKVGIQLKEMKH
jgi:hypothetical protein